MKHSTAMQIMQIVTEHTNLGARYDAMRVANHAHNVRVERRLADRPGGNRGRRATDSRKASQ